MSIALHFSSQFLKSTQTLPVLLPILTHTSQTITILPQSSQLHDPQLDTLFARLKIVTNGERQVRRAPSVLTFKMWMQEEVISPLMLLKDGINLVLQQGKHSPSSLFIDAPNTILIHDLSEMPELLCMSIFQLQRRCRLQRVLLQSQLKNIETQSKGKLRALAQNYTKMSHEGSLKIFLRFMRYNTRAYLTKMRKVFYLWSIHTHERGIERLDEEIIKQEFFCKEYKRNLLRKAFLSWRGKVEGDQWRMKRLL